MMRQLGFEGHRRGVAGTSPIPFFKPVISKDNAAVSTMK